MLRQESHSNMQRPLGRKLFKLEKTCMVEIKNYYYFFFLPVSLVCFPSVYWESLLVDRFKVLSTFIPILLPNTLIIYGYASVS